MNAATVTAGYVRATDGAPLYCVYHAAAADGAAPNRKIPVVLVPPFFEERKSAYSALRRLAEKLALNGHAALRFDYRGSGESGGLPGKRRWGTLEEDVVLARSTLEKLSGMNGSVLLGLRLGGTLALLEALRSGGPGVLALAPVLSGKAQVRLWKMRSKIRAELTRENAGAAASSKAAGELFDFDGYEVAPEFFDDLARVDLLTDGRPLRCPVRILQLSHRTELSNESSALVKALGSSARAECLRIEPFWDKVDDVDTAPLEAAVLQALNEMG